MSIRRYPGVQPFGDDDLQRQLFNGRDDEAYELLHLVLAERLVLLFARSGIGKSSLINAGLLKPLRDRDHFPMVVRVSGSAEGPIASLYEGIRAAARVAGQDGRIASEPDEAQWNRTSLWRFCKTTSFWRGAKLLSPVLIIDQFEELFTLYAAEERKPFIRELSDLVRGTRPRGTDDQAGPDLSDDPPAVKVVLALREDFYAQLEELRPSIPAIYKAPFRLEPLSREKARRAIVAPAGLEHDDFLTPPFGWQDAAVEKILDFLSEQQLGGGKTKTGDVVEPFQLQLVCQHFEDIVGTSHLNEISAADLGGQEAIRRILSGFYEDTLTRICDQHKDLPELRHKLEKLCEYGLITARGRRLLREESTIMEEDGVAPEILRDMVELRLLRKEPRIGDNYYELTHDTLIEPIRLSRDDREAREARAREEQRRLEALAQAERERRLRGRMQMAAALAALFLVVGGAVAWFQFQQQQAAAIEVEEQKAVAAQAQAQAVKQEQVAREAEAEARQSAALAEEEKGARREAEEQASTAILTANKANMLADKAVQQRTVVEIRHELAALAERQHKARQLVEEAQQIAAQGGGEEAENQVQLAKDRLTEITQLAEARQAELEAAQNTIDTVQEQVEQTDAQGAQPDTENVEQQLVELKQNLEEVEKQVDADAEPAPPAAQAIAAAPPAIGAAEPAAAPEASAEAVAVLAPEPGAGPSVDPSPAQEPQQPAASAATESAPAQPAFDFEAFTKTFAESSICEQFDALAAFEPDPPFGPQADFKLTELDRLSQLGATSAVVVTQKNLLAGPRGSGFATSSGDPAQCVAPAPDAAQTFDRGNICSFAWISSPGPTRLALKVLGPDGKLVGGTSSIEIRRPNRLEGERMGYRVWYWNRLATPGEHQLLLVDSKDRLLCRSRFAVE